MDPQLVASSPYPEFAAPVPQQAEVDDFLRKKRKAREHKACYPCRQRKVKCDLTRPCKTCRDREHPDLCNYHPPNKRQEVDSNDGLYLKTEETTPTSTMVTLPRGDFETLCHKLTGLENSIAELRREMRLNAPESDAPRRPFDEPGPRPSDDSATDERRQNTQSHTDRHGLHTKNESGEIVHFGGGSIPALLYALGQGSTSSAPQQNQLQEFLGKSVLPLFGLDNESATYPFVDLWGLPHGSLQRGRELAKALPSDAQMVAFVGSYRDLGHIIYPGTADLPRLESDLSSFLAERSLRSNVDNGVDEHSVWGKSYHWLGLLFAVLASGAQSHDQLGRKERELTSQVFICCSFECLRFTNFLSQPNVEDIQALLIMGNVMTNNMNAGTAWSLLGLTIRLAQGLGLHQACPPHIPHAICLPRARVWWAIVWQDSLLSISYDRNVMLDVNTMDMPQHFGNVSPYHTSMYRVSKVALAIVRDRASHMEPREQIARINQHRGEISRIIQESAPYLRDSRECTGFRETVEHWGLYLHTSYALSELCRPAISRASTTEMVRLFKQVCLDNLANTVEAYLGLNNVTFYARQSWGAIQRGLSSALLLGILGEHERNDRVRKLVGRLVTVMSELTSTDEQQDISAPIQRGIRALQKFNIEPQRDVRLTEGSSNETKPFIVAQNEGKNTADDSLFTPSTKSDGTNSGEEESSPHSVLNMILWGTDDTTREF